MHEVHVNMGELKQRNVDLDKGRGAGGGGIYFGGLIGRALSAPASDIPVPVVSYKAFSNES